ncbi:MAG: glutathione peroxidase [Verrucomicrobiae bacterium]|nr:glutathione peroxidase [Verrucomicrobiae bacterium]
MKVNISDLSVKTGAGVEKKLSDYKGQVLLIVNVASQCGYTPQYKGLEALNQKYKDKGLRVLGFPCNDFGGQEPGGNEEIRQFCTAKYGVTFELMDKVVIKGDSKSALYERLIRQEPAGDVGWNFEKFLVGKDGTVLARYKSGVGPEDAQLLKDIEKALQEPPGN